MRQVFQLVAENVRTIEISVNLLDAGSVIKHDLVSSLWVKSDIWRGPIVRIPYIEFFTQFVVNEHDWAITRTIRSSERDEIIKNNIQVKVGTKWRTILHSKQERWMEPYLFCKRIERYDIYRLE